jgi:hypothetical protein
MMLALTAMCRQHSIRANPRNPCQNFSADGDREQNHHPANSFDAVFVVKVLYYVKTGNEIHRLPAILSFASAEIFSARWLQRIHQ